MSILKAIILGIVQGATEFLPISSSGHLSVLQHFMGIGGEGSLTLTVFLHIGTLLAVILVYYKTFWALIVEFFKILKDLFTGKLRFTNLSETRRMFFMMVLSCVPLLFLMIPVGGGMQIKDIVSRFAEDDDIILEGCCFLITAFLLLFGTGMARTIKRPRKYVKSKDAFAIGVAQLFAAALPGVSRSGSTISTGMIFGVSKDYMVRYSFVLGTPAILAASMVEIKDTVEKGVNFDMLPIIIGVIVSAIVGVLAIKLIEYLVKSDKFRFFGYYCTVIGFAVIIAGIIEKFM